MAKIELTPEQEAELGPEPIPDGRVVIEYLDDRAEIIFFQELKTWSDGHSEYDNIGYRPYVYLNYHDGHRVQIPREHIRKLNITMNSEEVAEALRVWRHNRRAMIAASSDMVLPPEFDR